MEGEQAAVKKRTLAHGTYDGSNTDCVAGDADIENVLLWPLSIKEANAVNNDLRIVDPEHTDWATSCWWLRSPGARGFSSAVVGGYGGVDDYGDVIDTYGVRPAFNLNLESVLFTSAAESGKSSGAEGANALKAQSDQTNNGNEWKVTVTDDAHSGFAVSNVTAAENGVSVTYTGAATGTNEYISAIITDKPITDSSAKITYYGRVKNCTSASDTVTINTAGKLGTGDTLYVFNEQYNGNKKTDYASALQEVTIPEPQPAEQTITVTVKQAANPLKISAKTASVKYNKLKKKNQTLAVTKVINFKKKISDKRTYTLSSAKKGSKSFKKYFAINKTTGKVTVKKGLAKGTYKVAVKVKAKGNANYKASAWKSVTFKVRVKLSATYTKTILIIRPVMS